MLAVCLAVRAIVSNPAKRKAFDARYSRTDLSDAPKSFGMINMRHLIDGLKLLAVAICLMSTAAQADETVNIGGSRAVLIKPDAPYGSVILMPGGDGAIRAGDQGDIHGLAGNQLVRTRHAYAEQGLAVLVVNVDADLKSAVQYMAAIKRPVTVIATSRGTLRAARGIARGARPDALVLTSGFLSPDSGSGNNVMSILGSPAALPHTLVIHHTQDSCKFTLPAGVEPFIKWSGGRAHLEWVSGGADDGDPCEAQAHHGFNGLDSQIVGMAASFR